MRTIKEASNSRFKAGYYNLDGMYWIILDNGLKLNFSTFEEGLETFEFMLTMNDLKLTKDHLWE